MLNGRLHRRQGFIISELPFTVFTPVTLYALKRAKFGYIWRATVFTLHFGLSPILPDDLIDSAILSGKPEKENSKETNI